MSMTRIDNVEVSVHVSDPTVIRHMKLHHGTMGYVHFRRDVPHEVYDPKLLFQHRKDLQAPTIDLLMPKTEYEHTSKP
jgi:hypothetical protein